MKVQIRIFECTGAMGQDLVHTYIQSTTILCDRRFTILVTVLIYLTVICRWRFIIHAGVDGYSRTIVYMHCSDNNRASTLFQSFPSAITEYGLPSRVRADHGEENMEVANYMLMRPLRGTGRGSFITGRSVHNS